MTENIHTQNRIADAALISGLIGAIWFPYYHGVCNEYALLGEIIAGFVMGFGGVGLLLSWSLGAYEGIRDRRKQA
jgi:hypothetical protein